LRSRDTPNKINPRIQLSKKRVVGLKFNWI
jgi:hypothetical protein